MIGVARQVHLAVLADDPAVGRHHDRGVVAVRDAVLDRELGIAQIEADAEVLCQIEQRMGRRVRHLALEPGVDLGDVVVPVAREEGGQRQLGEHHDLRAHAVCLAQHGAQPAHHDLAVVAQMDRPELGRCDPQMPRHGSPSLRSGRRRNCGADRAPAPARPKAPPPDRRFASAAGRGRARPEARRHRRSPRRARRP